MTKTYYLEKLDEGYILTENDKRIAISTIIELKDKLEDDITIAISDMITSGNSSITIEHHVDIPQVIK